ncbi:MAG: hypothetical protein WAT22_17845 [Saprospiraceae bacterium]|jgi:hypothetical protein
MIFKLMQFFTWILKILATFIVGILMLILFLYWGTTIYNFGESKPFSGDKIHNPYENLPATAYKANFHGHSRAWGGITHGTDSDEAFIEAYINKGYDLACLSNYHKISHYKGPKPNINVPVYEHGYNIKKAHYLTINAKKVSFWDFPLWQSSSHQQSMIQTLRQNAEMVAIAHPKFGGGRSFVHMKQITGYHFTEVLNHYRTSEEHWDTALSTGKLSWILADDDVHDLKDPEIFQRWNIIFSDSKEAVLKAMKEGKNYGVESFYTNAENTFLSCKKLNENTFKWTFEKPADSILFVGQNGVIRQKTVASDTATYTFTPDDTYIRVIAKNQGQNIYLNPLVRYHGSSVTMAADMIAEENTLQTLLWKAGIIALMIGLVYLWWKVIQLRFKSTKA